MTGKGKGFDDDVDKDSPISELNANIMIFRVKSWRDFLQVVMPFMIRSSAGMHRFGLDYPPYLFRGQRNGSQELVASIFRGLLPRGYKEFGKSFFKNERTVIGFVRDKLESSIKCSEWDLVAIAQHYGVPTRFLDWSSDPFVALAFAFDHSVKADEEQKPAIWVLRTNVDDFCIPKREDSPIPEQIGANTKIYLPAKIVSQVFAQDSYLMRQVVEKTDNGKYKVVPVEENVTFKDRLWKIEFEIESFYEVAERLRFLRLDTEHLLRPENWGEIKRRCNEILCCASK